MGRSDFLYSGFLAHLRHDATPCQDTLLRTVAQFVCSDDNDILVVNGYAGTGKTTAVSAVISTMKEFGTKCVLLAPTGRAAKVLSSYAGQPACTVHKHIYRQKSVGGDGFGQFSLFMNKDKETLFVVDEVSLIGIDAGQQQSTAAFGSGNLLDDLITFVRSGVDCKLILIGDSAQLPPIGLDASPALLKDYMLLWEGCKVKPYKDNGEWYIEKNAGGIFINIPVSCFNDISLDKNSIKFNWGGDTYKLQLVQTVDLNQFKFAK